MEFRPTYTELSQDNRDRFVDFTLKAGYGDLPEDVKLRARLHLLDLIGVAASSIRTPLSAHHPRSRHGDVRCGQSWRAHPCLTGGRQALPEQQWRAACRSMRLMPMDGMPPTKGHIGVAILPALLAMYDHGHKVDAQEFLFNFVLGLRGFRPCRSGAPQHRAGLSHVGRLELPGRGRTWCPHDGSGCREAAPCDWYCGISRPPQSDDALH